MKTPNSLESQNPKPLFLDKYDSFGDFDREALRQLLSRITRQNREILELDCWLGTGSTSVIISDLRARPSGKVYCVDTWQGSPNVLKHLEIAEKYDLFGTFLHNVALAGGQSLVTPMRMSSIEASCMFGDGSLDFVFIDSDHSYASTIKDINAWLPKVAKGGILCGHDCEVRLDYTNEVHFRKHQGADCIPAVSSSFLVNHPGVIIAVGQIFGTSAHLWAEEEMVLTDGRRGRATLWDVTL